MKTYWAFWKRGFWAWLLMLFMNLSAGLLLVPLAFAFRDNMTGYWISALVAWLVVGAPVWGWLFERFSAGSSRIATDTVSEPP